MLSNVGRRSAANIKSGFETKNLKLTRVTVPGHHTGGGSRTHTGVSPLDFESSASAISPLRRTLTHLKYAPCVARGGQYRDCTRSRQQREGSPLKPIRTSPVFSVILIFTALKGPRREYLARQISSRTVASSCRPIVKSHPSFLAAFPSSSSSSSPA